MKKIIFYLSLILLLGLPAASIFYKSYTLDLPLLPPQQRDGWVIQIELRPDSNTDTKKVFPLPDSGIHQKIGNLTVTPEDLKLTEIREPTGRLIQLPEPSEVTPQIARIHLTANLADLRVKRFKRSGGLGPIPKSVKKYLEVPENSSSTEKILGELEESLLPEHLDSISKIRAIYYWITEEFVLNEEVTDLEKALILSHGSRQVRSELFTLMARRAAIPTRTVVGIRLSDSETGTASRQALTFYNEVYVDSEWYPVDVNRRRIGDYSSNLLILNKDWDSLSNTMIKNRSTYSIIAEPSRTGRIDTLTYIDTLNQKKSALTMFSFHKLPLSVQTIFYSLLFLPFGAVVLSMARNIIGIQTFGIFTPILLTLFFIETSLWFGAFFFILVLTLGFIQRYVLDRFHLLAIPRLSILFTLVIMTFGGVALLNHEYNFFPNGEFSMGYFPIVITTVFIERFSIHFVEEGPVNTFKTLVGTFLVASLCYLLFQLKTMKLLVFTHPELLLVAIALCILIGSYKGYRLSEFFRFRDLSRQ